MKTSDKIDELVTALAKAQASITAVEKNRTVKVKGETKSGRAFEYSFDYTTLDAVIEHARKPLTDNGLWFVQTLGAGEDKKYFLETTLVHSSGQWITSQTPVLVEDIGNQKFGAALTYMKRYALSAMLGISSEEDDDANSADGNQAEYVQRPAKPVRAPVALPRTTNASTLAQAETIAQQGESALRIYWEALDGPTQKKLEPHKEQLKAMAKEADAERGHIKGDLRNAG